jgi:hypothetical protein
MANLYKEREQGQAAEQILGNPVWAEAWEAYRARILEEIEAAPSNGQEHVMHLKRLLAAATSARAHMTRIMKEGAVAAKMIELEDRKTGLRKIFG